MKEIYIERNENLLRIAVKQNGKLSECIVEEKKNGPIIGEIYKGRIKNIIPGTNSIFVDLGLEREGYMYYSDELKKSSLKKGDDILVEVIKEPIGNKGAKLTSKVSIPGKYAVLNCYGSEITISKRITNSEKKKEIREKIKPFKDAGVTIRTEGANTTIEKLQNEINKLYEIFKEMHNTMEHSTELKRLYGENYAIKKVVSNNIGEEHVEIITNNQSDYDNILKLIEGEDNYKVTLYDKYRGMFDFYSIEKELLKLRHHKVNLKCGGSIVIDRTEAMYVIDVNSGKNIKENSFDKTILETNLQAAKEIGRQILLRNLSGIIVIDFIDMRDKSQRPKVMSALQESLREDKGNSRIFPFTELDLVQIARKRAGKSVYEYMEEECSLCKGRGIVLKLSYIEGLIRNEIIKLREENSISSFYIQVDNVYKMRIKEDVFSFLKEIDALGCEVYINYVDEIDGYKIEPILFQNQKENLKSYRINIE